MIEYRCDHDPAGVCWLCSDQVPWWREARERKGIAKRERPLRYRLEPPPRYDAMWREAMKRVI